MDIIIKDVPGGCEKEVKEMALLAIERFLHDRDVQIPAEVTDRHEQEVDAIRVANSLNKKYTVTEAITP